MTCASHYHCNSIFITIIDTKLILDGTSRLYNAGYSTFMRNFYTIRKRKEGITGQYRSI